MRPIVAYHKWLLAAGAADFARLNALPLARDPGPADAGRLAQAKTAQPVPARRSWPGFRPDAARPAANRPAPQPQPGGQAGPGARLLAARVAALLGEDGL